MRRLQLILIQRLSSEMCSTAIGSAVRILSVSIRASSCVTPSHNGVYSQQCSLCVFNINHYNYNAKDNYNCVILRVITIHKSVLICQVKNITSSFITDATTACISLCYARSKHLLLPLHYYTVNYKEH